jgi:hypothetical protein
MKNYNINSNEDFFGREKNIFERRIDDLRGDHDCYTELRRLVSPLVNVFTVNELMAILDAYNEEKMDRNRFNGIAFIQYISSIDFFESVCKKYYIQLDDLIHKIENMHPSEVFIFLEDINWFFNTNEGNDIKFLLQTYAKH